MANVEGDFTDVSQNPPSNTPQHPSASDSNVRSRKYNLNGNEGTSSNFLASPKKLLLVIGVFIVISIVIILCVVLPIMLTRKTSSTVSSTTLTSTISMRQQFLTNCQSSKSTKQSQIPTTKNQNTKVKMHTAPAHIGNRVLIKNTYMVEFASDKSARSHFRTVTRSLKVSENLKETDIQQRRIIESSLFSGISFTVNAYHSVESIEAIEDAIAIYPVYTVHLPNPIKSDISPASLYDGSYDIINSYNLTGTYQVHKTFNNFGAGVKVAVIDSGVYYLHPALGGCFGAGCKVAFGYDLIGDDYNATYTVIKPDDDPIDNCSTESHGTHVAGIIASNSTGISETFFTSYVPFIGVAPQVTIGAYVLTEAIYRAYNDNADIINLSLGGPGPYSDSSDVVAVQRVSDAGVYVVISAGDSGYAGLQTTGEPSNSARVMSVASIDSQSMLTTYLSFIITPDGSKIFYQRGSLNAGWQSIVNLTIIVNNPNAKLNDGCSGPSQSVLGAVVLYFYNVNDSCDSTVRCNLAALAGAAGCFLYNADEIQGATNIPSGSISYADGLNIIATVTKNPSTIYTFTNFVPAATLPTGGTPSSFSSFGLTGDLFLKPQLAGIGGNVYSTVSPYAASLANLTRAYNTYSGTSMAAPYVAGTLALFLASIGNPSPSTASGYANNGICRPRFSTAMSIFQSTAQPVNIYNSSLLATTAQQGAGLVDAYHALTSTTILSTSELSLNDTVRKASSYKFNVTNIGNEAATYKISHQGAALATGKTANDDQLLGTPLYSADYANVSISRTELTLESGAIGEITLQFRPPPGANSNLVPIYSGFIYVTNQITGEIVHLSYVGVAGDYGNARIIVRNSSISGTTGIWDSFGSSIINQNGLTLNASATITIRTALAWATRLSVGQAIIANSSSLSFTKSVLIISYFGANILLYVPNVYRNAAINISPFFQYTSLSWGGAICTQLNGTSCPTANVVYISPGQYQIQFSVLKHFGNLSNPNDYEVYRTPIFNLVY